jgi:predicted RNase H-like HicB family nuclease
MVDTARASKAAPRASTTEDVFVVPAEQIGVGVARVYSRQPNRATVERIVVTAILELFADALADFESVVRRHGDVTTLEQHVDIRAEQEADERDLSLWAALPTPVFGPLDERMIRQPQGPRSGAAVIRYMVIVERGGSGWGAHAPDLPGCVAVGETREEAVRLVREAIELHIDALKQDGSPVPAPSSESELVEVWAA